jgi:DHA2 family multidrug resistance protein
MPGETVQEVVRHRAMITVCTIGATVLQLLDQTIANVALPFMQGSFSASFDEISWVLTSYITASAIMTAPVGWLAARYGRKSLYVSSILGFTITSMLCGAAQSLGQIVVFRVLQGAFGAALAPLSQATLLDIYPPERRGFAMAILGMGIMLGPIMGPTLGGWLTETYNWRWVFYINLPFGMLAAAGLMIFLPSSDQQPGLRFDWLGWDAGDYDRCHAVDADRARPGRFSSEIIIEAVFAGLGCTRPGTF